MALTSNGSTARYPTRPIGPYARANAISGGNGTGLQVSLFCWARLRATPGAIVQTLAAIGNTAESTFFQLRVESGFIAAGRYANVNATRVGIASSSSNVAAVDEWFPIAATLDCTQPAPAIRLFVKEATATGVVGSADTSTTTFDNIMLFRRPSSAATDEAASTTDVAEVALWPGLLTQAEFNMLASGVNPLAVRQGSHLAYFPLVGDMRDLSPVATWLRPVGAWTPLYRDHPPVQMPPRRRLFKPSFPPITAEITGEIPITAEITANLSPFVVDGGDTHDGLRRSRRERRLEALRQRADAEKLADAQALRLSLEAALGLAAEVAPAVAPRVAEAVDRAPKPADVDWRRVAEDAEQYARLSRAVAKLSALVQAEARRLADEDDDDAAFLLGIA